MRIHKGSTSIHTPEEWFAQAPPKGGKRHWTQGRSAYELAAAWCGTQGEPAVPAEVRELLAFHPDTRILEVLSGTPELQIRFDRFRGEPRNADLALTARDDHGVAAITVEGKADEPYGEPVDRVLRDAVARIARDTNTNAVARVQQLAAALLRPHSPGLPHLGELRYQLLTAAAGTLAFAEEPSATRAVLIVHEFVTDRTADELHQRNAADLDAFVRRLTRGEVPRVESGQMLGPFALPGAPLFRQPVRLYLGKAVRVLRGTWRRGTGGGHDESDLPRR